MLKEIIFAISASGIAIAALAWLAKAIVLHFLSKDVETFKAKIQAESEIEIEKLKSALNQTAYEHEVVFGHLHKQRLEAILQIHAALLDVKSAVERVVTLHQGPNFHEDRITNGRIAEEKARDFYPLFEQKKLFLDEKLAEEIDALVVKFFQLTIRFNVEMTLATSPITHERHETASNVWTANWNAFEKELKPIMRSLENQFRSLLGVSPSQKSDK
jgi:hypothetical protein